MYQKFPMWTHKEGEQSRIVHSQDELDALGEGWSDVEYIAPGFGPGREMQEYPKWVGDKLVHSAEEEAALKPAEEAPATDDTRESDERTALMQIAEEKGVKIDKRWSNDKIRAALEAA
jgi:hypothetical protein